MSTSPVEFFLDGVAVTAEPGETLWETARRLGTHLPHLCHADRPGYRPDGNCRACMVEIEGERSLSASCIRHPTQGMKVHTVTERAERARHMVLELLLADQPEEDPDPRGPSALARWCRRLGLSASRLPRGAAVDPDHSHPAMHVSLTACIHCTLCVRACREVQVNDVIGMARRGRHARIVFDQDDPMGASSCVACGECVQVCPTGALLPATAALEAAAGKPAELVASVCPYCGVGCQLDYRVQGNRIVGVDGRDGPANHGRLCVKGRFGLDYVAHPERLTRPLIRRDGVPKHHADAVDPARPGSHFREASWEEALDCAAAGFAQVREHIGGRALAGFGSAKCSNEEAYLFQKLVRSGFGSNNVDHCTRLCHASSVAALLEGIGSGAVTAAFTACLDSDVILVIGANPTENHPVAATFIKQAVRRGTRLVVMDPRGTALGRHATHMLRFTPGSDTALLNALLHVIVTERLFDAAFVRDHTEGFEALARHVGRYPPEAMAKICGIPAETLRAVARLYARARAAIIFWGMGVSQHVHGTDNARCLIALACLTGQVGRPGTGLHPLRGQNNVQGASDAGLIPMMLPDYRPVDDAAARMLFEHAWARPLDPERGLTVVDIMKAARAGEIRAMYIMGENPAMSDPDVRHARDALASLSHLVVQDIFLTETAFHADVVLPACAWPEKTGTVTNTNRQVQLGRQAVAPPGAARPDWWIIQELARRLGLGWHYAHPREVYAEMAELMPSLEHITWDRLEREDAVTYPCPGPDRPGESIVFGDRFPRDGGRARLVPVHPLPPDELPDDEFPLVLSTGRQLEHWHTGAMTRRASLLDELEPEAVASLCARQLESLAITAGARVRIVTRRGAIELKTRCDEAVPYGMVFVPFCYAEAAANVLTNPALDPLGKIPEFKFCAARIEASDHASAMG